ncbi:MAG: hypothetical protein HY057_02030 [Rhodospirillales bacterium]|nr:hypothetical protein [Rhodospirillales bacterium]
MRAIQVSTDTFAAIWADRRMGEETEDAVLRRKFGLRPSALVAISPHLASGAYVDRRYGVRFPEGFEIFRNYKNTNYRAKVTAGRWLLLNSGDTHDSLNALSKSIGASENSWINWRYRDQNGDEKAIDALRDKSKVSKRRKSRQSGLS